MRDILPAIVLAGNHKRTEYLPAAGLTVFTFVCAYFAISCVDIGFHIRTGEYILTTRRIPSVNTFSFSCPDQPWLLHQWAPAVLFTLAWRLGGVTGLIAFKALIVCSVFAVVRAAARGESSDVPGAAVTAVSAAVILARPRFFCRPVLFSALFLAVLFAGHRRWRRRRAWLFCGIPVLMAVWANTHAGVVYGFALLGSFWIGELAARLRAARNFRRIRLEDLADLPAAVVLACLLCVGSLSLVNPNGPRVLLPPFLFFLQPFWRETIAELGPPSGRDALFLWLYTGALAGLLWRNRKEADLSLCVSTLLFGAPAFRSQRCILMYAVVSAPHLSGLLARTLRNLRAGRRCATFAAPLLWCLALGLVVLPDRTYRFGSGFYPPYYPLDLYRFMRRRVPSQNLYNDLRFGGSILWFLYPEFRPFIDGRGDAYSIGFWRDVYLPVSRGERRRRVFERYRITAALVFCDPRSPGRLARELYADPDWALIAFDDTTLLFLRRSPPLNQDVIAAHEFRVIWPGDPGLSKITPATWRQALDEATRAERIARGRLAATAAARALLVGKKFKEAAEAYSRLADDDAADACHRDYLYALFMSGDIRNTERVARSMIRKGRLPDYAYFILHYTALRRGAVGKARNHLVRAIELNPENTDYRRTLQQLDAAVRKARSRTARRAGGEPDDQVHPPSEDQRQRE